MDADGIRKRFADRLGEAMEIRGISKTELAKRSGITRPHLYVLLRGEVGTSIDVVAKVAEVLEVDPSALLADKPITRRTRRPAKR